MSILLASFAGLGLGFLFWYFSVRPSVHRSFHLSDSTVHDGLEESNSSKHPGWDNVVNAFLDDIDPDGKIAPKEAKD